MFKNPSPSLIDCYLPAQSVSFLPLVHLPLENLWVFQSPTWQYVCSDHRVCFHMLFFCCYQGLSELLNDGTHISGGLLVGGLWFVVFVILAAVNHCLHPGRPEDTQNYIISLFLQRRASISVHPVSSSKARLNLLKVWFCLGQTNSLWLRGFMRAVH